MNAATETELARLSGLIDHIYRGATDIASWDDTVCAISEWMAATRTLLFTPSHTPGRGGFSVTHDMDPAARELWTTKYHAHDIWGQRMFERGLVVTGKVVRDQELVTDREWLDSTISREFLAPLGVGRLLTGVVFSGDDNNGITVACSVHRPFEQPFAETDAAKLELLLPHLSRALGVMFRLRDAEFKVANSLAALDRLAQGILLFRADGGVGFANEAAREILAQEDGLRLTGCVGDAPQLVASGRRDQEMLDNAIREAVSPDIVSARHFSVAVGISRLSGQPPYLLNFSSLPGDNEFGVSSETPRAIAFLRDSTLPIRLDGETLRAAYGLTPAEVRAAELIAEGLSTEEAARELEVSVNTVKTHLNKVYEKTNTGNRARLVKLLLSLSVGR